jgi:HD-GYP domain-containing protein (c-di-GMP phosphodiesterase class II)
MFCNVPLRTLPVGARLGSSIYDERQTKLLAAGMEITEQLLATLTRRNVDSVVVSQLDLGRILAFQPQGKSRHILADRQEVRTNYENDVSRVLDHELANTPLPQLAATRNPFADKLRPTESRSYDADLTHYLAERREIHVQRLHTLVEACGKGNAADLELTADVARESLSDAVEDVDAFACLGANPYMLPYPSRHVIHTAMTASAIGVKLGLDERQLHELSVGCLIHDLGMLSIDRMTVGAKKVLESVEFAEIAKHPLHTFDLIEKHIEVVPLASRMVAYQMHERCDGSGYPRGKRKEQIHPLARIAAVADSFTALVSARPHRPGMLPYYAVEKLLKDTARGLFDSQVVRALLHAVGLFPVGSYVSLSNGCVGRVIRANLAEFTKPLIEMWPAGRTNDTPAVVDLAQVPQLTILRPLSSLHGH